MVITCNATGLKLLEEEAEAARAAAAAAGEGEGEEEEEAREGKEGEEMRGEEEEKEVRKEVLSAVRRLALSNCGHRGVRKCQKRPI